MGHSTAGITLDTYSHVFRSLREEAAKLWMWPWLDFDPEPRDQWPCRVPPAASPTLPTMNSGGWAAVLSALSRVRRWVRAQSEESAFALRETETTIWPNADFSREAPFPEAFWCRGVSRVIRLEKPGSQRGGMGQRRSSRPRVPSIPFERHRATPPSPGSPRVQ